MRKALVLWVDSSRDKPPHNAARHLRGLEERASMFVVRSTDVWEGAIA
jgi:hypothetical protein